MVYRGFDDSFWGLTKHVSQRMTSFWELIQACISAEGLSSDMFKAEWRPYVAITFRNSNKEAE